MNKLFFRAWLKEEKKMVNVENLFSVNAENGELTIGFYDKYARYDECLISECELMQGVEIGDKVVYEGDRLIITDKEFDVAYEVIIRRDIFSGFQLINCCGERVFESGVRILSSPATEFEVVGNVYESEINSSR